MSLPPHKQPVILQVLPELRAGGVERGTLEMAQAIIAAGWRAVVASAGGDMALQLKNIGATHITLPLHSKNPLTLRQNAKALERVIHEHGVDLVHARSRAPAWSAWWAARSRHKPFVTTFHGTYGLQNKWKQKYNSIMTRGDRVIAISHFIADHIIQNYEVDPARLRIIHRGVDTARFDPERVGKHQMMELLKSWRSPPELPIILMPGRLTRWKGQDVFIRALAQIPHRNFMAMIVGDDAGHPTYRKELEALISELGLEGHARIAPNTPHMAEAMKLAHMVVAPSLDPEAFGRIPVEAQAMGKPIVATNHGGFKETIMDGETGWLVPVGDVDALSKTIAKVLALPLDEMNALATRARQHAVDYFSSDLMKHKTINVYSELLWPDYAHQYIPQNASEHEVQL